MHLGGKIEMRRRSRSRHATTSRWPTPRASRAICQAIAEDRESAWNLTIKQNTVAVVSDGTAVLGLGDIGPEAAMPVMEGKAVLFKEFGGVDAWPLCLATKDADEIVAIVNGDRAGLRRDQPRGHLGAPLLRDRSSASCGARHPRLPRRPARHRDRGARRAPERARGRREADRGRQGGDDRRRCRRGRRHRHPAQRRASDTDRLRPRAARSTDGRTASTRSKQAFAERTNPTARQRRRPTTCSRAPTSSSASRPGSDHPRGRRADGRGRDRVRDGQPDAGDHARGAAAGLGRRRRAPAARTTRTRSTTCSPSPASSAAPSTSAPARSPRG